MAQTQLPLQSQPELFDLYRAGLKTAADLMKASLENAERLQNQQLVAIRTALVEQARTASELGQAKSLDELMAFQTRMAGAQLERTIGLWTSLWQSQMEQAREMMSGMASAQAGLRQESAPKEQRKSA